MNSRYYRDRARLMLSGNWGMALLVTLVALLLGGLLVASSSGIRIQLKVEDISQIPDLLVTYLTVVTSIAAPLATIQFIIGGTVQLGYCHYLLKLHDNKKGEKAGMKDLFSQFDRLGDGFVLHLLTGIYTFLWTLVFIIPGFVAIYKYAMAPFILLENPGMKPNDAITTSKEMMVGRKGGLFLLDLSFIGWMLLSALTLGIGNLWLNPYMNAARAAFYRDLRADPSTNEASGDSANIPTPVIYYAEPPVEQ